MTTVLLALALASAPVHAAPSDDADAATLDEKGHDDRRNFWQLLRLNRTHDDSSYSADTNQQSRRAMKESAQHRRDDARSDDPDPLTNGPNP